LTGSRRGSDAKLVLAVGSRTIVSGQGGCGGLIGRKLFGAIATFEPREYVLNGFWGGP